MGSSNLDKLEEISRFEIDRLRCGEHSDRREPAQLFGLVLRDLSKIAARVWLVCSVMTCLSDSAESVY